MVSFRPEGLNNTKGGGAIRPLFFTTEYTEHTEETPFRVFRKGETVSIRADGTNSILEHFNLIRIRGTASFVVSPVRGVFSDAFDSALHKRPLRGSLRTRRAFTSQNPLTPPAEHHPQKEDTDFHKML